LPTEPCVDVASVDRETRLALLRLVVLQRAIEDRVLVGSAEDCVGQIERWQEEIGLEYLVLRFRQAHATGPRHERIMSALRIFGEKIIGHFR